jgi:superfamily II DNA or RNA helicase
MKFETTHDGKILTLVDATVLERKQLSLSLTRKLEHYNFLPAAVKRKWNGIISYFHKDKFVPVGLWSELKEICETFKFSLEITGLADSIFYKEVSKDEFQDWVDEKFDGAVNHKGEPFIPRKYQVDTAYKILCNKICISELTTAAGKSLIIFMCIAYFQEKQLSKKILMIVPSIDLVIQAYEDFNEYNTFLLEENKVPLNIKQIHGGEKKDFLASQNIHISTFQSLANFQNKYFTVFDTVIVDECHRTKSNTIRECISKCSNVERRFGLTGTTPKQGTLDSLTLQAYLGPKVIEVKAKELQDKGDIAEVDIAVVELIYPEEVQKRFDNLKRDLSGEDKGKLLKLEQDYIIEYQPRIEIISKVISKVEKNQLVLFHRQAYGKKLKQFLEENTDKEIHFIYGEIKKDDRADIKRFMETGKNKVLVASYGTLSTGVNIKNIHNIHFTESFKSDVIVRQSIGRGLRQHKDKDKLRVYDFVDALNSKKDNMLMNHSRVRRTIYKEQEFDYIIKQIHLA